MSRYHQSSQSGNVLFLILIAVTLFAALSYAVTQSTRSGGGDASKEKNLIEASVLLQYGASVRQAVIRMKVGQSIASEDLLFDNPASFSSLTANEIPRAVFHPNGGGAIYQNGWDFTSSFAVTNIGTTDNMDPLGTSDIIAIKNVSKDLCFEINKKSGIVIDEAFMDANMDLVVTDETMDKAHPGINGAGNGFWGTLGSTSSATLSPYDGHAQGCFYNGPSDVYIYYDVIVAR